MKFKRHKPYGVTSLMLFPFYSAAIVSFFIAGGLISLFYDDSKPLKAIEEE